MSFQGENESQYLSSVKGKSERDPDRTRRKSLKAVENELRTAREFARDAGHDIRNALNIQKLALHIVGTQLKRLTAAEAGQAEDSLNEAKEQCEFIEKLVLEFCTFSKATLIARPMARVQDSVAQALQILGRQAPKHCEIVGRLKPRQNFPVESIKLLRVLVNLLQNAFYSLTQKTFAEDRPTIWIEAGQEKSVSWLRVRDNGTGIEPAHLDKVFETSFTTKTRGLGLGLGICRKVIRDAGGEISVKSTLGEFAEFTICFPRKARKSNA